MLEEVGTGMHSSVMVCCVPCNTLICDGMLRDPYCDAVRLSLQAILPLSAPCACWLPPPATLQAIKQSVGGSGTADMLVAAALALEEEAGRQNRKRQREPGEEEEAEERDSFMQQALLQSLDSCREAEEATLQRTLLASLQGGGQQGSSGAQRGQQAQQGGEEDEAAMQRVLLESLQGGGQRGGAAQRGQQAQQGGEEEDVEMQEALLASMQAQK